MHAAQRICTIIYNQLLRTRGDQVARLEDITVGSRVKGITQSGEVSIVATRWIGQTAIEATFKDSSGTPRDRLLYRDDEVTLEVLESQRRWSFDGDGAMLRLVSEAKRISLAHLFDPLLAVHTSLVEPLPHQITAVYGELLPRQPLRFLLADDPGAGKTIMAGLFIKELLIRADLSRCLIICPGSLVEQWQDELFSRFQLPFEIMTNDKLESARTGNWFLENPLAICRLDKLSRNEDVQAKLSQTDWDLVVFDEAHKLSASFYGGEIKETKRYKLGKLVSGLTRHLLLMTATPHNGKEEDFQLFLALLDGDRFEGKFRDGVHTVVTDDIMRRMVKEKLVKFDGKPLFPERRAYTMNYTLSSLEAELYKKVTEYVREEFNRAESIKNDGRKGTVGFALMALQRRLASSPEAIYQSLCRRKERLEKRLREEKAMKRGAVEELSRLPELPDLSEEDIEDLEDAPDAEVEETEESIVDLASAARTIRELEVEIDILRELEALSRKVRNSGEDKKWEELSSLLQINHLMFDKEGNRRKLVIFSEHRATLDYLTERIRTLLGKHEAVVNIHGAMGREERKKAENAFKQDKDVQILIATDAAGEGINLQRAHLMVNYDLPWNPNRLEQRFGRIHRIGQTEVCHLWNLVANETREGDVFLRLCEKLENESKALNGQVFDVLGKAFADTPLRKLLQEAILYGDRPDIRDRLNQVIDEALDHERLKALIEDKALATDAMDSRKIQEIRDDMERAEAKRLQPHFIASFFIEAFKLLGGRMHEREPKRYEISRVPSTIRSRDRQIGRSEPVLTKYERVTFEKELINVPGKPSASFLCPGHPLLDAAIDLILEQYRHLLKSGAVLVNPGDTSSQPYVLFYLENKLRDARSDSNGNDHIISTEMHFVEIEQDGDVRNAGAAPYLDYRPATDEEKAFLEPLTTSSWLQNKIEDKAAEHAITKLVPEHLSRVRKRKEEQVEKTFAAVKERLTKEINYWDHRAQELRLQEQAGKTPRLNSSKAAARADELSARLRRRTNELEKEKHVSALAPNILGGALIVPQGLLNKLSNITPLSLSSEMIDTETSERLAMDAVMSIERKLGGDPKDVGDQKLGWDIESRITETGRLKLIEVKGRVIDADTITITKNEILKGFNMPDNFVLAICLIRDSSVQSVYYVRNPFEKEPDFNAASVNYKAGELIKMGDRMYPQEREL